MELGGLLGGIGQGLNSFADSYASALDRKNKQLALEQERDLKREELGLHKNKALTETVKDLGEAGYGEDVTGPLIGQLQTGYGVDPQGFIGGAKPGKPLWQKKMDYSNGLIADRERNRTNNKPDKDPSQSQSVAGLYAQRMEDSLKDMDRIEKEGYDPSSMQAQFAGDVAKLPFGKYIAPKVGPKHFLEQDQASRNFINATLRRESGAAISQSEFDNARAQYLPQPSDTPEVKAQKSRNRQTALAALRAEATPRVMEGIQGELRNVQGAPAQQPQGTGLELDPPKVGEIMNGHKFIGGDPKTPQAWQAVKKGKSRGK